MFRLRRVTTYDLCTMWSHVTLLYSPSFLLPLLTPPSLSFSPRRPQKPERRSRDDALAGKPVLCSRRQSPRALPHFPHSPPSKLLCRHVQCLTAQSLHPRPPSHSSLCLLKPAAPGDSVHQPSRLHHLRQLHLPRCGLVQPGEDQLSVESGKGGRFQRGNKR